MKTIQREQLEEITQDAFVKHLDSLEYGIRISILRHLRDNMNQFNGLYGDVYAIVDQKVKSMLDQMADELTGDYVRLELDGD